MARVLLPSTRAFLDSVMEEVSRQGGYTIEEIRKRFPHGLPDWDSTDDGPLVGESVTWEQWREAFPPPERAGFSLLSGLGNIPPLGLSPARDQTAWTPCIFDAHTLPAAAYLDPDGWTEIMKLGSRTSEHWRRFCPNTYTIAKDLLDGLIQRDLWGQHRGKGQWKTLTAGKKPGAKKPEEKSAEAKRKHTWPDKRMELIDVLNSLGNPDRHALGSTDARLSVYEREDIWRHPFYETRVNRLRIDVDMDRAWGRYAICDGNQEEVAEELSRESALIKGLGLTPYFFKTGGRGHQIVIPVPTLDRSVASLLVLMIRYVLTEGKTPKKKPKYKVLEVDKSNLECLMRLPLGRHAETKAVAWMVDPDTAMVLPPDQQAQAVIRAWNYGGRGCELLEASREALGQALDGMRFDRDLTVYGATDDGKRFQALSEMVVGLPDCPLVRAFHATCADWHFPSLRSMSTGAGASEAQPPNYICGAVSSEADSVTLTAVPERAEASTDPQGDASRPRMRLGKGWACQVLDESFEPGGFYEWSRSSGSNGVGAAILYCDGDRDRAEEMLIGMAREVDCRSEEERQKRIDWIKWAVPRNNIDTHYERPELSQHRDLHGVILSSETERANHVVDELVRRRKASDLPRKAFPAKALTTLRHIVELVQMEARNSEDGFVRVSARTLAAEIAARWPEYATDGKDVSRQMQWITRAALRRTRSVVGFKPDRSEDKCLFCVLERLPTSRRAFDAKGYTLGSDFIALLPEEG